MSRSAYAERSLRSQLRRDAFARACLAEARVGKASEREGGPLAQR
jgi:hypothetical protein